MRRVTGFLVGMFDGIVAIVLPLLKGGSLTCCKGALSTHRLGPVYRGNHSLEDPKPCAEGKAAAWQL